jgi:hypothetical protein
MKFSRQLVGSVAVIVIILVDTTVSFVKTGAKLPVLERTGIGVNELFHVIAQERGKDGAATGAADQTQWILDMINAFPVFRKLHGKNCAAMAALEVKEIQIHHTRFR